MAIKIYLAGQMAGLPELNYPAFYEMAEKLHKKFGWEIINPAAYKYDDDDKYTYHKVLYRDFLLIDECDGIYLMKGWENSSGASCELALARLMGLEIMFQDPQDASAMITGFNNKKEV